MITKVCKKYTFEACHFLPNHKGKCNHFHGHSYKLFITFSGEVNKDIDSEEYGMILDFNKIDSYVKPLIESFDHSTLNDFYPNPTAEVMATDIFKTLEHNTRNELYDIFSVKLFETEKCYAEVVAE